MADAIPLERFSSNPFTGVWGNGAGGAADLTGYQMSVVDCFPAELAAQITVSLTTAALGTFSGVVVWSADIPDGRVANFRLALTQASGYTLPPKSMGPIFVEVT